MFAKNTISILSAGALLAIAAPAMADPPHWAPAHGYRAKQNVVVHRHVQPVVKRTVVVHHHQPVVRRTVVHRYEPAHRHVVVHRQAPVYAAPAPVYHQPNILGTVMGGVIGAVIGSHVGGEMATGAGAVIGGVIGSGL
jgi:uncharacterized protein YcfJ